MDNNQIRKMAQAVCDCYLPTLGMCRLDQKPCDCNCAIGRSAQTYSAVKEVLGKLKEEINQAIKSNYKVIKEEESSTIIYQWCKGKIDALRGIDNYIDELAKEFGVEIGE